jgi:hypothetical protein
MMRTLPLTRLLPLLCVAGLVAACGNDTPATDDANETTAASGTDTQADAETDAEAEAESPTDTDEPTTDTNDDGTFIGEESPTTEEGGAGNLGDQCSSQGDCAEGLHCNGVPGFGGICSECNSDADCEEGNCTFTGAYFGCGDGSLGQNCESDEVCGDDLYCAEVVNLGGLFNGNFCSECQTDEHCPDGQLCAPSIEFSGLEDVSGHRTCIEPNTAPNDQLCDADGAGDEQCIGYCMTADLMGLIEVGICGDCKTDEHCDGGTCTPAMISFSGFSGSTCG